VEQEITWLPFRTLCPFHPNFFIQERFLTFGIELKRRISEGAIIAGPPNPLHMPHPRPCRAKAEELYLNRRGAKTYKLLLQVCHSCEVPGEIYT
jgi:hypothetical protein